MLRRAKQTDFAQRGRSNDDWFGKGRSRAIGGMAHRARQLDFIMHSHEIKVFSFAPGTSFTSQRESVRQFASVLESLRGFVGVETFYSDGSNSWVVHSTSTNPEAVLCIGATGAEAQAILERLIKTIGIERV